MLLSESPINPAAMPKMPELFSPQPNSKLSITSVGDIVNFSVAKKPTEDELSAYVMEYLHVDPKHPEPAKDPKAQYVALINNSYSSDGF